MLSDRSHHAHNEYNIMSRNKSHKVFLTSSKKQRACTDSSQKRRVNEQARLMKMKNFPPDFFSSCQDPKKYSHKQSYSVDRVESRRQKRQVHHGNKDSILTEGKQRNKPKRTLSESRPAKRIVSKEIGTMQVPPFFLKNETGNEKYVNYKQYDVNCSNHKMAMLKNSSLKSVRSETSILPDPNLGLRKYSPKENSTSVISQVPGMSQLELNEICQPLFGHNDVMPRKFSHINKLAHGLTLNEMEDLPFNLAKKIEASDTQNLNSKVTTIKFKRRNSGVSR